MWLTTSQPGGHFTPEEWADFSRLSVLPDVETTMRKHLESGCRECLRMAEIWQAILELASGVERASPAWICNPRIEIAYPVPPAPGELQPRGQRHAPSARSHFLFQRNNLLLDVHVEAVSDTGSLSMAGQLMNPVEPTSEFGYRLVTLLSGTTELAKTATNQFGEFQVEFLPAEELTLVIHLAGESVLVTPLPAFVRSSHREINDAGS